MIKNVIKLKNGIKIGDNQPTAINVLLGCNDESLILDEYRKLYEVSKDSNKVDIITDLSLCYLPTKKTLWYKVIQESGKASGTVPVYQALNARGTIDIEKLLYLISEQAELGVSVITIHPTINREIIESSRKRLIPFTSRGGGIIVKDLVEEKREVNAYELILDRLISIAQRNGTVISIGSSFRSGTILDANDITFRLETERQLEIANKIHQEGVPVIIETPGHAALDDIEKICDFWAKYPYPIMPLGPLPTDIGAEQDDIAAVIGATMMGYKRCADVLSVITMDEHCGGIPSLKSILSAIRKYNLARHIIDICKLNDKADDLVASKTRAEKHSCVFGDDSACERCGKVCPLRYLL